MKTSINILLSVIFLCQALSTTLILVNFELNREEIAKTLCVKKEEPKNCCQGSCHLKKQLQAEEKKEQAPLNTVKIVKQFPLFYQKETLFAFQPSLLIGKAFMPFQFSKTSTFSSPVFHPPC